MSIENEAEIKQNDSVGTKFNQTLTNDEKTGNQLLPMPFSHEYIHNILQTQYKMNKIPIKEEKKDQNIITYTYDKYQAGDIVEIVNLEAKAKYNGLFGQVIKFIPNKSRFQISVNLSQNVKCNLLVKSSNLSIIYARKYAKHAENGIVRTHCCHMKCLIRNGNETTHILSEMTECMECRSVFYCSQKCRKEDTWHALMCSSYKKFAKLEYQHIRQMDELFQFDNIITYCDEYGTFLSYLYFLNRMKLTNKGIWKRLGMHDHDDGNNMIPFGELNIPFKIDHYSHITTQQLILPSFDESQIVKSDEILRGWDDYCRIRNFSFKSPVARFMSWILSIYYALTQHIQIKPNFSNIKDIIIHLVGVEVELDLLPYFKELLCLLPGYNFVFYLFGDSEEISEKYSRQKDGIIFRIGHRKEFVKFNVYKTIYEKSQIEKCIKQRKHRIPNIVIGLNPGISAAIYNDGRGWLPSLIYIMQNEIPSLFTEYFCTTIWSTASILRNFKVEFTTKYIVNPFRSPVISFVPGSRFSQVENGFICTLY